MAAPGKSSKMKRKLKIFTFDTFYKATSQIPNNTGGPS